MKLVFPALFFSAAVAVAGAQTTVNRSATLAKPTATHRAAATASGPILPPGVPRVRGVVKTAFSLRYQDIKIGTGAEAEPNKIYHVLYTGYLAADGHKFDSSDDHRQPLKDKDGKPVLGPDGKPELGAPEPILFPQGYNRVIPGFDEGFAGMKIGGKRRLFIPWQLAYGAKGRPGPDDANPGIPPKADLIFDIELVDVTDLKLPQGHPGMGGMMPHGALPAGHPPITTKPAETPAQSATPQPKQ